MGLAISYFTNIDEYTGKAETNEYGDIDHTWMQDNNIVKLVPFEPYSERADGVKGLYTFDEYDSFRAGSYGGYNRFRELLAATLLKVKGKKGSLEIDLPESSHNASQKVWDNEDVFKGMPFYEQICFADNEGVIGPDTSEKLAGDYEQFEEEFVETVEKQYPSTRDTYVKKYRLWKEAFKSVAGNGAVMFH